MGGVPEVVPQRVGLDDRGAEVGEHLRAPRAGDGQAEVEHDHALERGAQVAGLGRAVDRAGRNPELGQDLVGVLPGGGGGALHRAGRADHVDEHAGVADAADLGVVDLDDHAGVEEVGVEQGLLDRAHPLEGHADLGRGRHPVVGGEAGVGRLHLGVVVGEHDELAVVGADAARVVTGSLGRLGVEPVTAGDAEGEGGVGHPVLDPPAVAADEVPLAAAGVHDPAQVAVGVGVLGLLPGAGGGGQHPLEQRRLDPLALPGGGAGEQRRGDAGGGEERGAQAGPGRAGVERAVALGAVGAPRRDVEEVELDGQVAQHADGGADPAPLLPVEPGAGGDQRVDGGSVALGHVAAVGGDRAEDEPRVAGLERGASRGRVPPPRRGRSSRRRRRRAR